MTPILKSELTAVELSELKTNERTITNTKGAFVACGHALERIRDKRLYRASYGTFEEYCLGRWGWSRKRAYQLIEASVITDKVHKSLVINKNLSTTVDIPTENAARALGKVPEEKRVEVLKAAAKEGKVTAPAIAKAAKEHEAAFTVELDKTDYVIPEGIVEDWHRAEKASLLLHKLSEVKCAMEQAFEDKDIIMAEVNNTTLAKVKNVYGDLQRIIPHAVCPTCVGKKRDKCALCKGRGFLSKFLWDTAVPESTKAIRAKSTAKK